MPTNLATPWWPLALAVPIGWALYRVLSRKPDIGAGDKLDPKLSLTSAPDDTLDKVYEYVVGFSDSTISWYRRQRQPKRQLGGFLRMGVLIVSALAGLVPLSEHLGTGKIPPVWGTVLIALAGVFVSIDKLGDFTSGWVRYMHAQQRVERLQGAFVLEWQALRLAATDTKTMVERAQAFLLGVGKVVDEETQEWAAEFQEALKELERERKVAAQAERSGALEVTVKNAAEVSEWSLEVDGSLRGRTAGKNLALTDISLGFHRVKAYGHNAQGKVLADERTVKVEGGGPATKELELT